MKVLYVITRAERGGAQIHLLDLIANLPAHIKPIVAVGEDDFLCQESARLGVPVRYVPELVQPIKPFEDIRALLAIRDLIKREAPDIVHAHTSKAGLIARCAARLTATPVVFTAHTWSFADGIPLIQRLLSIPLERIAALAGGKIITVSQANTEMALKRSITDPSSIICIWNGVPDVSFRAAPGSRRCITLITTARFAKQKDHSLLLRAMAQVSGNWRLLLVGDGPTRTSVEQEAVELGLTDKVQFLGDRSDVARLLAEADIFVLPSKWEGLPLSILEAMRAGLPVVATDIGGVAEAVADGVTGYLTTLGDVMQLSDRVQKLIALPELITHMGCLGRQRYERDFRVETMVQKTLAVYRETQENTKRRALTVTIESET
ncbi:MAG: glycosyltransferase family 4 protein [Acidobacteriaceae bacterium]|nr:glycosyltransferase family 4 protein [Acidobacteriaceae bacterium]